MPRRKLTEGEKRERAAKKAAEKLFKKGEIKDKDSYIRGYCRKPSKC